MRVVIDASAALTWCYADERTPESSSLLEYVNLNGAVVPQIWPMEVANALLVGEIRKRITNEGIAEQLDHFRKLPIEVDSSTANLAWKEIITIARQQRLTTYDASYIELANRLKLPLASRDKEMIGAAIRLGIDIIQF